jgi:acetyl esterase
MTETPSRSSGAVDWMSRVVGRPLVPPRRESVEDLIHTRGFLDPDPIDVPAGVEHLGEVVIKRTPGWDLTADVWRPADARSAPVVIHLHGGGYCGGSGAGEAQMAAWLAQHGVVAVCPSYSLAPERPFPAALEDVHQAHAWVGEQGKAIGADATRVVWSGGSAGAGLAAAACLELFEAETSLVAPRGLVLLYGLVDFRAALSPEQDPTGLHRLWASTYLGGQAESRLDDPRVSPARSRRLEALPPTYVSCGARDRLLPQSLDLLRRLASAGVDVTGSVVPGSDHAFTKYVSPTHDERDEFERISAWIVRRTLATPLH